MARGIVTVINSDGMSGQVQQDETNDVFNFTGQDLTGLGLTTTAPNNSCKFQISTQVVENKIIGTYASNLIAAPPLNYVTVSGPSGSITANEDDVYTISSKAGVVSGSVVINGGKVIVEQNAQINGPVNVTADGMLVARGGAQVVGNVTINSGGSLKVVKTGVVNGSVGINGGGRLMVGNADGIGTITGLVDIAGIRRVDISAGSVITG